MKSRFPNNKFIIGTAQLHSNYGILHNKINSINESNKILFFAKKKKYQMIDAASIYKRSEKIIGNFSRNYNYKFKVFTKIKPFYDPDISKSNKISKIKKSIEKSIQLLGENNCYAILIHDINNFYNFEDEYLKILLEYKKNNNFNKIGVSLYNPSDLTSLINYKEIGIFQIPLNIIDIRWYSILKQNEKVFLKKFIYGRSVFLQGLLLNYETVWPKINKNLKMKIIRKIGTYAKINDFKENLPFLISYVLSYPLIKNITLGIENVEHFRELDSIYKNLKIINNKNLLDIIKGMPKLNNNFLNPAFWGN